MNFTQWAVNALSGVGLLVVVCIGLWATGFIDFVESPKNSQGMYYAE